MYTLLVPHIRYKSDLELKLFLFFEGLRYMHYNLSIGEHMGNERFDQKFSAIYSNKSIGILVLSDNSQTTTKIFPMSLNFVHATEIISVKSPAPNYF